MTKNYPPPTPASGGQLIVKVLINNLYYLKLCSFLCNLFSIYLHLWDNYLIIKYPPLAGAGGR